MRGATPKQTFRQWKVKTLEIEDGETRRITKKILHDEYMKPYPFETPKRLLIFYNLCNPLNTDLRCALFIPSFLFENKLNTTEKGAAEVRIERVTEIIQYIPQYQLFKR